MPVAGGGILALEWGAWQYEGARSESQRARIWNYRFSLGLLGGGTVGLCQVMVACVRVKPPRIGSSDNVDVRVWGVWEKGVLVVSRYPAQVRRTLYPCEHRSGIVSPSPGNVPGPRDASPLPPLPPTIRYLFPVPPRFPRWYLILLVLGHTFYLGNKG